MHAHSHPPSYSHSHSRWPGRLTLGVLALLVALAGAVLPATLAPVARAERDACAVPGKDGIASAVSGVVNTYFPGRTATLDPGATEVTLGPARAGRAQTPVSAGDLLLVVQMQAGDVNASTSDQYGDGVAGAPASGALDNAELRAGHLEYVVATNAVPAGGGTLTFRPGLLHSYRDRPAQGAFARRRYQVIRVPQYWRATVDGTLTAPAWDGFTGGVVVLDVDGDVQFAGAPAGGHVNVDGLGFRGGAGRALWGGVSPPVSGYGFGYTVEAHASKGEGYAGTPHYVHNSGRVVDMTTVDSGIGSGYSGGAQGRGAPGNAGGGGNSHEHNTNAGDNGGGGGGNGGAGGRGGDNDATVSSASLKALMGHGGAPFGPVSPRGWCWGAGVGRGRTTAWTAAPGSPAAGRPGGEWCSCGPARSAPEARSTPAGRTPAPPSWTGPAGAAGAGACSCSPAPLRTPGWPDHGQRPGGRGGGEHPGRLPGRPSCEPRGPGGGGGGGVLLSSTLPSDPAPAVAGGPAGTARDGGAYGAAAGDSGVSRAVSLDEASATIGGASLACRPRLVVTKSTITPLVLPGGRVRYSISLTVPDGPQPALQRVVISDPLPARL